METGRQRIAWTSELLLQTVRQGQVRGLSAHEAAMAIGNVLAILEKERNKERRRSPIDALMCAERVLQDRLAVVQGCIVAAAALGMEALPSVLQEVDQLEAELRELRRR
jgi:hypothetical protein